MVHIEEFIPVGSENAVTRAQLRIKTGLKDRDLRRQISEARQRVVILNLSDGSGYFRPAKDDIGLIRQWISQETSREKMIIKAIELAEAEVARV